MINNLNYFPYKYLTAIFFLFSVSSALGQSEKNYLPTSYWGWADISYKLPSESYFFGQLNTRASSFPNNISTALPLDRMHFMVGYNHKANQVWNLGASERLVIENNWLLWYTMAYFRHEGKLGSIDLNKQFGYEWISHQKSSSSNGTRNDYGRFSGLVSIGKDFNIKGEIFRPEFSYQFFIYHKNETAQDRRIDLTRMRIDFLWKATEQLYIGLFAMRDTQYNFVLGSTKPVYDEDGNIVTDDNGNPQLQEIPSRNINSITPVIGFNLRWELLHTKG
ncbi:hypothetical protein V6R21_19630 [Limibacter armeniacum]|uniref:hypothetical protein n=1 Tax=Limibacter armeniacum TaxID=466084 RepID=UPI002FE52461